MAGAVGMPYPRFLLCNTAGALLWAGSMVSLAWLGGRWIPFSQMVGGVIDFGLGALLLVALVVVVPKLLSRLERRQLMRQEGNARPANPTNSEPTGPVPPAL
jgi:membrane protein DedA with SNARE-associated domain